MRLDQPDGIEVELDAVRAPGLSLNRGAAGGDAPGRSRSASRANLCAGTMRWLEFW